VMGEVNRARTAEKMAAGARDLGERTASTVGKAASAVSYQVRCDVGGLYLQCVPMASDCRWRLVRQHLCTAVVIRWVFEATVPCPPWRPLLEGVVAGPVP
jgi:hypothetical protein